MKPWNLVVCLAALNGCASAPPAVKEPWPEPPPASADAEPQPAPAERVAAAPKAAAPAEDPARAPPRSRKPEVCEAEARVLHAEDPERAWAALRACIARGDFTNLARVLEEPWLSDARERSDAAVVLAKLIAARGGDVLGDLAKLRTARVPVFGLKTAMENPSLYKGRTVVFRARVQEVKPLANNQSSARLAQVDLLSRETFVSVGSSRLKMSGSASGSGSVSGSYQARGSSGRRSSGSISASGSASGARRSESTMTLERGTYDNMLVESGLVAVARLGAIDPFFQPGLEFVMVARFDGVRAVPGEGDEPDTNAVVALVAYFESSPILAE